MVQTIELSMFRYLWREVVIASKYCKWTWYLWRKVNKRAISQSVCAAISYAPSKNISCHSVMLQVFVLPFKYIIDLSKLMAKSTHSYTPNFGVMLNLMCPSRSRTAVYRSRFKFFPSLLPNDPNQDRSSRARSSDNNHYLHIMMYLCGRI